MTTDDAISIPILDDYRDPLDRAAIACRKSADRLRSSATVLARLEADVESDKIAAARLLSATEADSSPDRARDEAATRKGVAKARRLLRGRLPVVADELLRLSVAIRECHASLKNPASLKDLEVIFESLINGRGAFTDQCYDLSAAVDLARGVAFVRRNGDIGYDPIEQVATSVDRNERDRRITVSAMH